MRRRERRAGRGWVAALDAGAASAYMPPVMMRFLGTLLVLMSGLAAEGVVTDARAYGGCAQIGAVEIGQGATRAAPCAAAGGMARAVAQRPDTALMLPHPAALALPVVTVRTGIDRARE